MIQRNPHDIVPRFNFALCIQSKSIDILNKDFREVKETKKTFEKLELAKKIFSGIISSNENLGNLLPSNCKEEKLMHKKQAYSRILKIAEERLFFIKNTIKQADKYLKHDTQYEKQQREKIEENKKKIKEIQEKERLEIEQEEQKKMEKEREKDLKATEHHKQMEKLAQEWAIEQAQKKQDEELKKSRSNKRDKKGKRKKREEEYQDMRNDREEEYDHEAAARANKLRGEEELKEAGLTREEAENLGGGGLDDLHKAHKKKRGKKDKKNKKDKKSKKSKKKRLKRNRKDPEEGEGDMPGNQDEQAQEDQVMTDEIKKPKYDDE